MGRKTKPSTDRSRPGFVHVSDTAKTLVYALSPDRDAVLEGINVYARQTLGETHG